MLTPQFNLPIHNELVVDLFAGGGGASTGIEAAIGRSVDIAINHDEAAIAMHTANHPQTKHYCSDIFEVDPLEASEGRPVGLLWASPSCTHFSKARGGTPVSKQLRSLAWVVVRWASKVRPRVIMMENVEEMQFWGPVVKDKKSGGFMPCKKRKGKTFDLWIEALKRLGYQVEWKTLVASDYGTPTIRKRLFLVARCDGLPIEWPEITHGNPLDERFNSERLKPWETAKQCIDWTITPLSIHGRKKPLAQSTLKRINRGIDQHVLGARTPYIVKSDDHGKETRAFLIKYYGNDKDGVSIYEPLHTIPTKDRFGLVQVELNNLSIVDVAFRMLQPHELYAAQGFAESYIHEFEFKGKPLSKSNQVKMCGNSVCPPVAQALVTKNYADKQFMEMAA